jgi:maltodextrin utilization protein YvdJ
MGGGDMEEVSYFLSLLSPFLSFFSNFFTFFYLFTTFPSFFLSSFTLVPVSVSFYLAFSSCSFFFFSHDPHNCTFRTTLSREFSAF